ncbi:FAD-binding protein [Bacillus thuringiensis]|uniref:FAD-binding protein n=1 Tax=Bacillus thuringiensis TaxID=1428 RepID=UPI001155BE7D
MKKRIGRLKKFKNLSNQDVIIVGSGPAGSAAAIFCAQRRLRIIIIDGVTWPHDIDRRSTSSKN